MKPERLITLPLEVPRLLGGLVLWAVDKAIPMQVTPETRAASIQYYSTDHEDIVA